MSPASKGKILFIDDDSFLRKVYQSELHDKGYEVLVAVDGEDGMEQAQKKLPDLIILDLIMPKKNGFEFLADMQLVPALHAIPVIVLSNLAQSDDQEHALRLGAVDYLVKDNTTLDTIAGKIDIYLNPEFKQKFASRPSTRHAEAAAASPADATTFAADSVAAPIAPKATSRSHNFCSKCGSSVKKSDTFCSSCGNPL